jgi:hypothetical protein
MNSWDLYKQVKICPADYQLLKKYFAISYVFRCEEAGITQWYSAELRDFSVGGKAAGL